MPQVSVCIPTYNRAQLLMEAVESVIQQTYSDWELIICDDGSQDNTADLVQAVIDRLATQAGTARINYIRHPQNIGKSNNMRSGFEAATGQYFIKFDDDDRLTPDFLAQTVAILDQHPEADFVGTDHWIIGSTSQRDLAATDLNSQKWGRTGRSPGLVPNLLEVVFVQQSFQVGATLFRRSALVEVDYMRPNLGNCEDNDLFVRLALAGKHGYYLPSRLMEYRMHAEQQGIDRDIRYLRDKLDYLDSYRFVPESLEQVRRSRLTETQLLLGLRLVIQGDSQAGRRLIQAGRTAAPKKAMVGLILSYLPLSFRQAVLTGFRNLRPKDYSDRVRAKS